MSDYVIDVCNWCGESFVIRSGCECKKLASNQEWLDKAGLIKKPIQTITISDQSKVTEEQIRNSLNNI